MQLQSHSYKPDANFFGKDGYHLGLELELEAPDEEARRAGLEISQAPQYCYAKTDGSLADTGWELVTHPISRKLWIDQSNGSRTCVSSLFKLIEGLRKLGYTSHTSSRCGLHIHVSYSAFRGVLSPRFARTVDSTGQTVSVKMAETRVVKRRTHLYWFMKIINSELYKRLSQRDQHSMTRWTNIRGVESSSFTQQAGGRYFATNQTDHTLEVRLFRGNMREDRIRKAIESVVAAVEYSRTLNSADAAKTYKASKSLFFEKYLSWIAANKATYPNLYNYLVEINEYTEASSCA